MDIYRRLLVFGFGALLVLGLGCKQTDDDSAGDDDAADDDAGDDDTEPVEQTLGVVSYNLGLAHGYVDYAAERLPALEAELAGLDVDVACLQEVWDDGDVDDIAAATAAHLPHGFRYDSRPEYLKMELLPAPCEDLNDLVVCATKYCDGLPPDELTNCIFGNCLDEFSALPKPCAACLAAHLSEPFPDIVATCTSETLPPVYYGGANGLMLLANQELQDTQKLDLDFFLIMRKVLYARVDGDTGPIHLFCTHLTADLSDELPYAGEYESYEAENAAQIDLLFSYVEQLAGAEPALILGDFNMGPANASLDGAMTDHYDTILAHGVETPYVAQNPDLCTFCSTNALNGGTHDNIIDHAFFLGFDAAIQFDATRILDQEVEIEVEQTPQMMPLSDHYGIRVTATWEAVPR